MGVANVGTDSLHVHVYFKWPYDKSIVKRIKTFLINVTCFFFFFFFFLLLFFCFLFVCFFSIVWCSESARMYDHIICGCASVHFILICSCTCICIWKEDTCTCTSKRSILFFFTLCIIWTPLEHLNIKSLHMLVQYLHAHTRGVPVPVAQSVKCPLRETWRHGFDPGPRHTKSLKMVLAASRLALRLTGKS